MCKKNELTLKHIILNFISFNILNRDKMLQFKTCITKALNAFIRVTTLY